MNDNQADRTLDALQERAKELSCLYRVHELLNGPDVSQDEACAGIVDAIPAGWQFPSACWAKITVGDRVYQPARAVETPWVQRAAVVVDGRPAGSIEVFYTREFPSAGEGPFLPEERKLVDTIAERLAQFLRQRRDRQATPARGDAAAVSGPREWEVIVEFLRNTDVPLLAGIARRMINQLAWNGVDAAQAWLQRFAADARSAAAADHQPMEARRQIDMAASAGEIFALAARHMSDRDIAAAIEKWIKNEKATFLVEAVEDPRTSLAGIREALERFARLGLDERELPRPVRLGLRVSLARRLLTEDPEFMTQARQHLEIGDFFPIARRVISSASGHGKAGGKCAGLFLAEQVIRRSPEYAHTLGRIRVPRTWYLSSDAMMEFISHNHLEDVHTRKYLELDQIRHEYPHIVEVFRHSHFPADVRHGLSMALDDLPDRPLIVRSSSLLEDRIGAAFSGKYKSLFLANRGSKLERLDALTQAIAEVYASLFAPDPIAYRTARGLLDYREEMAILIQEVVGAPVGRYFFPAFAGVAFGRNDVRWSPRLRREDGLVRMVPGLGTRAVDRMPDDYPVLAAPGQPDLRLHVTPEETLRYAPRLMDVVNLESRRLETVEVASVLGEDPDRFPRPGQIVSVRTDDGLLRAPDVTTDLAAATLVVTFEGLFASGFLATIRDLLRVLEDKLGYPVDVEFASDGSNLYLLQCRAQSYSEETAPLPIPRNIPADRVLFTAHRYVSNGRIPDVSFVVYVDPQAYRGLGQSSAFRDVGRAIAALNERLPRRGFALIGPGRWGSRGDMTLGVPVTYSDLSNAAALIEVAMPVGGHTPDVSFGTHFFQDLVESSIRYLPVYPGDPGVVFNRRFLVETPNLLAQWLPEFAGLAGVLHVIDVPAVTGGRLLRIIMSGEDDEALGYLADRHD